MTRLLLLPTILYIKGDNRERFHKSDPIIYDGIENILCVYATCEIQYVFLFETKPQSNRIKARNSAIIIHINVKENCIFQVNFGKIKSFSITLRRKLNLPRMMMKDLNRIMTLQYPNSDRIVAATPMLARNCKFE